MSASVAASIIRQCKAANKCFTSSHQGASLGQLDKTRHAEKRVEKGKERKADSALSCR